VICGLSLDLDQGEWLAVGGPNGGGKSTLALTLAGLWPARRGTLELNGIAFGPETDPRRRAEVAVVLQDPASQLLQRHVADEIAFTARNLDRPPAEVKNRVSVLAERLGLGPDLARESASLSAGRQQLVLIAAALVASPRLLIADEPAAHLDPSARAAVLALIREEVARGLAVVWVTQDPIERCAADRTLDLGETADGAPRVQGPKSDSGSEIALTIRISSRLPLEGPRVQVGAATEIAVAARGVTAVSGPNGSGKSVILASASGLIRPDQITLEPDPISGPPPILATQYPEHQIFEEKVADELVYAAVSRGVDRGAALERAAACFEALGLSAAAFLERRCWVLSGGEKRLVQVIGALIAPAGLLCLDEPTAGLDPMRRTALGDLVSRRAEAGPVLVASQDAGWISAWAARSIVLN
jgi:energy-coupling factor transporter ATP-binding protein EcfA2